MRVLELHFFLKPEKKIFFRYQRKKWHEAQRQAIFLFPLQMMLKSQPVPFQQFTTTSKNLSVCATLVAALNSKLPRTPVPNHGDLDWN